MFGQGDDAKLQRRPVAKLQRRARLVWRAREPYEFGRAAADIEQQHAFGITVDQGAAAARGEAHLVAQGLGRVTGLDRGDDVDDLVGQFLAQVPVGGTAQHQSQRQGGDFLQLPRLFHRGKLADDRLEKRLLFFGCRWLAHGLVRL